jgi:hypothetical protein
MRVTDLSRVIFPIELRDVFVDGAPNGSEARQFSRYLGHKALVDGRSGRPICVVSDNYRVVTHEQSIVYGKQCVQSLFENIDTTKIQIFNIVSPDTASYCYIDLIHEGYQVNIWDKEVYLPYLRIANSYCSGVLVHRELDKHPVLLRD